MNKYRVELTAIVEAETANEAIAKLLEDLEQYDILVKEYGIFEENVTSEIVLNHEYTS